VSAQSDRERLALVVHEVRSPVAALAAISKTFAELESSDGPRKELISLAVSACEAIQRLVLDASIASLRRERVDLGEVATEVAAAAGLGGARVDVRVERSLPPIDGDPVRLRQALSNLVANAVVHGGSSSPVRIAVGSETGRILASVSDEGPGIAEEEMSRIFDAGVRLDAARPGSGLGLAIVAAIVAAHDGSVSVESVPGAGTTFTIVLPTT